MTFLSVLTVLGFTIGVFLLVNGITRFYGVFVSKGIDSPTFYKIIDPMLIAFGIALIYYCH